jgi:phosphatidylglycerol:prolipoprotein diacylglycerol transferase
MSAILWMLAVATGMVAAVRLAQRAGLDTVVTFWGALGAAFAGVAGGMAWTWTIVHLGIAPPAESGKLLEGDLSVLGAIVGVAAFVWIYLRFMRRPLLPYADVAATAGLLAYAVGRVGCFFNGCCFGTLTEVPWAVHHAEDTAAYAAHLHAGWIGPGSAHTLAVHPVALYHAAAALLLFLAALKARGIPGRPLAVAVTGYAAARFFLQFIRGDATPVIGALDVGQLFCLALLAAGVVIWRLRPATGMVPAGSLPSLASAPGRGTAPSVGAE